MNDIVQMVNCAYGKLRVGAFGDAATLLERALELDVEYEGVAATLKSVRFWSERRRRWEEIEESDRAAYLLDQWAAFRGFAARIEELPERCFQDIKYYIHATAVAYLLHTPPPERSVAGSERFTRPHRQTRRLLLIGHAYKAMGDFASAIAHLEQARRTDREWAPLLAELADCYSLISENRAAQLFFREAFFLGAAEICVESLDSPIIRCLVSAIRDAGVAHHVSEWIPVYGTLLGAFSVTRELKSLEYGRLLQSIFELEKNIGLKVTADGVTTNIVEQDGARAALVPRLINRYFWLIEHYRATHGQPTKVDDVLRRIEALDAGVHQQYVA